MTGIPNKSNIDIAEEIIQFRNNPLAFTIYSFDWEGLGFDKPMDWAIDVMRYIRHRTLKQTGKPIKISVSSGHGIGKSATCSHLILWALTTMPNTRVIVTANTGDQLLQKTWAELGKWYNRFVFKDLFKYNATSLHSSDKRYEKNWRADAVTWSISRPEAFAGLHNKGGRILIIFDEASSIDDEIWRVTEGALTDKDTEIIWICFGNPTRNSGRFYKTFTELSFWKNWKVDSRSVPLTNKELIEEWKKEYGEDSDFFRVRVKGEFPNNSLTNFIPVSYVESAYGKTLPMESYYYAPAIIGVDMAWTGGDESVIFLRQGNFSKMLANFMNNDDMYAAELIAKFQDEYKAEAVFIDQAYGTGVFSAGKHLNRQWTLVNFGSSSISPNYLNKRAEIWGEMKEWLKNGGVIPADERLKNELISPEYIIRSEGKIQLEKKEDMKKRGISSPNRADALALTFSAPIYKRSEQKFFGFKEFYSNKYDIFK